MSHKQEIQSWQGMYSNLTIQVILILCHVMMKIFMEENI